MQRSTNLILLSGILASLCFSNNTNAQQRGEYVQEQVIVKFKKGIQSSQASALKNRLHATTRKHFSLIGAELWDISGWTVEEAVRQLQNEASIEYAEPNFIVRAIESQASTLPDDPNFPQLWGLNNTGQTGGTPDADIDAPEAWDIETGNDVIVGVIDTGVDWTHDDLADNIWENPGEVPNNGIDDDGNGFIDDVRGWDFVNNDNNPVDDAGHGTHVAGTIAAVGNNGLGVVGVSWSAKIMPLKFLDFSGFGNLSDAISAIEYATMMGARVTNNSWGGPDFSLALEDAIAASGEAGLLFIAAAGNGGDDGIGDNNDTLPHFPSGYELDNIIAVAATDDNDLKATFSNFGAVSVDLGAPGVAILSTLPGNGYGFASGTSMATPHVTGVTSLIWSQVPGLSHLQVKDLIMSTVDSVAALAGITVTGGRLNAFQAMLLASPDSIPPAPVTDLQATDPTSNSITLTWTATGDDGDFGQAARYDIRYSTTPIDTTNFDSANQVTGEPKPLEAGNQEVFKVRRLDFNTTYFLAVEVLDEQGNRSGLSNVVFETTLGIPVIEVVPDTLADSLLTGEMTTQTLTVGNVGEGTLDFVFPDFGGAASLRVTQVEGDRLSLQFFHPEIFRPDYQRHISPGEQNHEILRGRGSSFPLLERLQARITSQTLFFDDMENGISGWTTQLINDGTDDLWHQTNISFNSDSTSWWCGVEAQGNYDTGRRINNAVISPTIDLTRAVQPITLSFFENYNTEPGFDFVMVDVTTDGGTTWIPLRGTSEIGNAPSGDSGGWIMTILDLSTFAGERIQIRFYFDTSDNVANGFPGWFFDDVLVTTAGISWLSVEPAQGTVLAGQSLDVDVHFDATGLLAGDYDANLSITSNDPLNSEVSIPARLNVRPAPGIAVFPDSLDFGEVFAGFDLTKILTISNIGSDSLTVDGITVDHPDFSVDETPLHLAPGEKADVSVTFTPGAAVEVLAVLTITSNDPFKPSTAVNLRGVGVLPPDISVSPASLSEALFTGEKSTQNLTIRNDGESSSRLDFEISIEGLLNTSDEALVSFRKMRPTRKDVSPVTNPNEQTTSPKRNWGEHRPFNRERSSIMKTSPIRPTTENSALPVVINDPTGDGGLVDISLLRGASTHDELQIEMTFSTQIIPADFGGYLSLDIDQDPTTGIPPSFGNANQDIGAEFEFFLFALESGFVDLIETTTGNFIGSYPAEITSTTLSFSTPLSDLNGDDGFMDVTGVVGTSAGPTDWFPDEGHGTIGGMAWLSADPLSGTVPGDSELFIEISFDATGLPGGDHNADILISSNDPDESVVTVPAVLQVTSAPDIFVEVDTLDFGGVYTGTTDTLKLIVENRGTADLLISSASAEPAEFGVSPQVAGIDPGETDEFLVTFSPATVGAFSGTLTLVSNDPTNNTLNVALQGRGVEPPVISVSPDSLSETLNSGESSTQIVTIRNDQQGAGDLIFDISIDNVMFFPDTPVRANLPKTSAPEQRIPVSAELRAGMEEAASRRLSGVSPAEFYQNASSFVGKRAPFIVPYQGDPTLAAQGVLFGVDALNNRIVEFNPLTGDILRELPVPDPVYGGPEGLAFDGEFLYYISGFSTNTIFQLDVQTGAVVNSVSIAGLETIDALGHSGKALYASGYTSSTIYEIDFESGSVIDQFTFDSGIGGGFSFGGSRGTLFVANFSSEIFEVDPNTWQLVNSFFAPNSETVWGLGYSQGLGLLFVSGVSTGTLYAVNPDDGSIAFSFPFSLASALASDEAGGFFLSVNPNSGAVPADSSLDIEVTFNATDLNGGDYRADLVIASNDPNTSVVTVPVRLLVQGTPVIAVSPDSLDFGSVFVGGQSSQNLKISNVGTEDLHVKSISPDNANFTVDITSFSLPPDESQDVVVTFASETAGTILGALTITSDDTSKPVVTVPLRAEAIEPPVISVSPDSLSESLLTGETSTQLLTIDNSAGASELTFEIEIEGMAPPTQARVRAAPMRSFVGFQRSGNSPIPPPELLIHGAPDTTGRALDIGDILDIFDLPFEGWTGLAWDGAHLWANNFITTSLYEIDPTNGTILTEVPLNGQHLGLVYDGTHFWSGAWPTASIDKIDKSGNVVGSITAPTDFIGGVAWDGAFLWVVGAGGSTLYQISTTGALNRTVDLSGLNPTFGYWSMVWVPKQEKGNLWICNETDFSISQLDVSGDAAVLVNKFGFPGEFPYSLTHDGTDLWYADWNPLLFKIDDGIQESLGWLSAQPTTGTVTAGSALEVEVTFDASGLVGGPYDAKMRILNNDPLHPDISVPAHLDVIGAPDIAVSDSALDFGPVFMGLSSEKLLQVSNVGTENLNVSNISADNSEFAPDVSNFVLAPGESKDVAVTFTPTDLGARTGTLTISSDDPDMPDITIALTGVGVSPPDISVTPPSFSFLVQPGDSATGLMTISNTGGSPLSFSIRDEEDSAVLSGDRKLYWGFGLIAATDTLFRSNFDGSGIETHFAGGGSLLGIFVDETHERVYWGDSEVGNIYSSNLGGTDAQVLISGLVDVVDLAVDAKAGKIYWTDFSNSAIHRANLDGSDLEVIVQGAGSAAANVAGPTDPAPKENGLTGSNAGSAQLINPWGIALDPMHNKVYWTEQNGDRISRANLDGSDHEIIIEVDLDAPRGIKLDLQEGKIYFVDSFNDAIKRANLDGSDVETLLTVSGGANPLDLELDLEMRQLYWTDNLTDQIERANFDGSGVETILAKQAVDTDGFFGLGLFLGSGWLTEQPGAGTVVPDSSQEIQVTANSKNLAPGEYSATILIESNAIGKEMIPIPVSFTVNVSEIELAIPDTLTAVAGGMLEAPIFLSLKSDTLAVAALGAAVKISPATAGLTFDGFTGGPIIPGPQFDVNAVAPDSLLLAFADFGDGPITENGLLATLKFQIPPDLSGTEMVSLNFQQLSASDPTGAPLSVLGKDGKVTLSVFVSITGSVQYCNPGGGGDPDRPVADLTAELTQNGVVVRDTSTDANGDFLLTGINPGDHFVLKAYRESGGTHSAITPTDAFLVVQHFLGNIALNGCQKLASDVDNNADINPTDALLIFNRFLGKVTEFVVGDWHTFPTSYDIDADDNWQSAPDSIDYPNLFANQINQDFYAVVSGDANLDWSPVGETLSQTLAKKANARFDNSNAPLQLRFENVVHSPYTKETSFSLAIAGPGSGQGVLAFGFELRYDASRLEIKDVGTTKIEEFQLGFHDVSNVSTGDGQLNGQLRFGGFSTSSSTIDESTVLFKVSARLKDGVNNDTFFPLRLGEASAIVKITESSASKDGKHPKMTFVEIPVSLIGEGLSLSVLPEEFALEANFPNPFNPSTKIRYRLPESASVRLQIFNVFGQRIKTLVDEKSQSAGFYEIEWPGRDGQGTPVASGVYFYRIDAQSKSGGFTKIRKMTLVK